MSSIRCCAFWLVLTALCFPTAKSAQVEPRSDEPALRELISDFFAAWAKEDLEAFTFLWSARSSELPSRKKALQDTLAAHENIEVKGLTVLKLSIDGEKATARVEIEMSAVEAKTGKPVAGLAKMYRSLGFVKEGAAWKVWREVEAEEDLAVALVEAKGEEERHALLKSEKDLMTVSLWRALNRQGRRFASLGDHSGALNAYSLALSVAERIRDESGIAAARNNIGLVYLSLGDYDQALVYFLTSLRLHQTHGNNLLIAQTSNSIGTVYSRQGDYRSALEHFERSLRLFEELGDKGGIALCLNHIGGVNAYQGNYALALDYQQRALKLHEESGNKIGIADSLHEIGSLQLLKGNLAEALVYFQKNVQLLEALKHKAGIAHLTGNIGLVHYKQGNYTLALEAFHKALELSESVGHKRAIALTFYNFARVYYSSGDYTRSLEYAERAASVAEQTGEREIHWRARSAAGKAYGALNQYASARRAFDEAIGIIENLRAGVAGGEQSQQRFFENKVSPYHAMVELLVAQNKSGEAFAYSERAKARVLLDVLQTGRVNIVKAMTAQEQEQERKLRTELAFLNSRVSRESQRPNPDKGIDDLKTRLQESRMKYEAFQVSLYAAHPELKTRRGEAQIVTLDEAAGLLPDPQTALLDYVVTDDRTYLFVLTKGIVKNDNAANLKPYTIAIGRKDLAEHAERFRQQMAKRDPGFRESARKLYDLLLKPARAQLEGKNALVIVPDGILWELPFQGLVSAQNRYLLEDHAISYAPSLTVLREMTRLRRSESRDAKTSPRLLAFGNPAFGKQTVEHVAPVRRDEKPLPEAEREAITLGKLYGAARSKVYTGVEAREDRLKAEAGKFGILHLATHGILNDANPMYSHVVLAQVDGSADEDGLLEAWEIMRLELRSDLVVLSACETARGRVGAGEGVIGLVWALFVAGSPTSVVSQWKVDSASTTALMLEFHRNLKSGFQTVEPRSGTASALRRAAMKLLQSPSYRHPFYWAGFIVVGDGL